MRISQIVESGDIYPALCDLAGIPEPDGLAGENLANHIINKDIEVKTHAFSQF
jgi:arylsulfatase A-like enzyme